MITDSAITAKSAQSWLVLSLLVNSGTLSDKTLYVNSNHKSAHLGTYEDVGCLNTKTSGASGTVCDNDLFKSGAAETGLVMPRLMKQYTNKGAATTPTPTDWLNTSTGYAITMNDSSMTTEQKTWSFDKGYRGIGGFNGYDTGSSIDGSDDKNCNSSCNIQVSGITGNNTTINLDMKFIGYRHEKVNNNQNVEPSYAPTQDNYSTIENGFGLFNEFMPSTDDVSVNDLSLTGTVYSDYVDKDTGNVFHDYPDSGSNWNAHYSYTITASRRLATGMFAGTKSNSSSSLKVTLSNVTLNNASVHSGKHSGGFIGNASNVTLSNCPATNVSSFGRSSVGGLIGKASDDSKISGAVGGTAVSINNVTEQGKGYSNNAGKKGRHSGVGGLVGMSSAITIENINLSSVAGGLIQYDNLGSDDSSYVGGILGMSTGAITINNCSVNQVSALGTANRVGGLAGGTLGNQMLTATNVIIDGGGTATLTCTGKESVGGVIGYSQAKVSLENVVIKNYIIQKCDKNESSANAMGGIVGSLYSDLDMKNVLVSDCVFEKTNTETSNLAAGGIIGRSSNITIRGYNIVLRNISLNATLDSSGQYNGNFIGTGTPSNYKIVGLSLQGDLPNDKLINNTNTNATAANQSNKYIIFSDYNGIGIPDPNNSDDDLKVGSGNIPIVNGSTVNMPLSTAKSPFATGNPSVEMQGGDLFTGDAMATSTAGLTVNQIVSDMNLTTAKPNKAYTVTTANTGFAKYSSNCFSTFKREWSDAGLPDDFKDFVVMVVEDPSRTNTTEMINSYVQLLTNTRYEMSRNNNNVYTVTVKKVQYNSSTGKFVYSITANLKRDASSTYTFYFTDNAVDSGGNETKPTFSLIDVAFKDPTGGGTPVYHLYIPVIVKKMIDVDFEIATGSGTPFDSQWYVDNHRFDDGKMLAENIGSVGTLYFTYTYKRTQKEWQDALDNGENFLVSYNKALLFTPGSNSGNLSDLPSATKLVLVDANPGRWGKEYYSTIDKAYNAANDKLSLNGTAFAHDGEGADAFSPVMINDLLNIKAEAGSGSEYEFVLDDTSAATVEAADGTGVKHKYRKAGKGETGAYKLMVVNAAGNNTQLAGADNLYVKERYYLSIYTKLENEPAASRDTAIHYYSVTADSLEGGSTKAKFDEMQQKPVIFANLFAQSDVKYYTYKNPNLPDYNPEEIDDVNNTVFVRLESTISFTNQASTTLSARLSSVDMYQSFLVYLNNTENNKVGIYGNPTVSASITVSSVNSSVAATTYNADANARVVLNYAEVLTNESITNYLKNGGGAVISADLKLLYPNLANRASQFASRSGNNTVEDGNKYTTVSAYSKIGFDSEKTALSENQMQATLKTGSDTYQDYKYYYIVRNDPALDYYAFAADDGRQFGQLGISANDLPDNTGKVTIRTAAEFDARPISSLIGSCDTVKITFTLQQKKQYSDGTFNYSIYEELDNNKSITDYLYNVHVDLSGASDPVLDSATNTYTIMVPRASVIALDGKAAASSEYVRIPIVFDVFTGTDTPKDSAGNVIGDGKSFETKGFRYANYKVVVSAQMMNGNTGVGDAPSDSLIYTNAKLITDYVK